MIQFKDFYPEVLETKGIFKKASFESFEDALEAANEWIAESQLKTINVETVVLPNIHRAREEGTTDVSLVQTGEGGTTWHQFIRVWYTT